MDADAASPARFDWTLGLAVACVACGWFLFSSLDSDFGALQLQFYFYNVLTLMHSPGSIIIGTQSEGATVEAVLCTALCVIALLASVAPVLYPGRNAWLGCAAPFGLMALVGLILYHHFSQDMIVDRGDYGEAGSRLIRFANSLSNHVGNVVTRRIHVGFGGYLALAASAYLAFRGLREYRRAS